MVSIRGWLLETLKQDDTLINAEAKAKTLFLWRWFLMRQKKKLATNMDRKPPSWLENHLCYRRYADFLHEVHDIYAYFLMVGELIWLKGGEKSAGKVYDNRYR